jgi:hypothetical protein
LLFYGLEAREDEKLMVACQIRVLATTFPRLWSDEMGCERPDDPIFGGRARAHHKSQESILRRMTDYLGNGIKMNYLKIKIPSGFEMERNNG